MQHFLCTLCSFFICFISLVLFSLFLTHIAYIKFPIIWIRASLCFFIIWFLNSLFDLIIRIIVIHIWQATIINELIILFFLLVSWMFSFAEKLWSAKFFNNNLWLIFFISVIFVLFNHVKCFVLGGIFNILYNFL